LGEIFDETKKKINRYKWLNKRVVVIDFRNVPPRTSVLDDVSFFSHNRGGVNLGRRAFKSAEELQLRIDAYFFNCEENRMPFTLSGLARALEVRTSTLQCYGRGLRDDYGFDEDSDEQFSDIIYKARQKIEEFAETNLYSKFGFNGAKFVLDVSFGWVSGRDAWAIREVKNNIKVKNEELGIKKQLIDNEDTSSITVNIVRKGESQ
jgi:hypothetical protein